MVGDQHTIPHGLAEDKPLDICGADSGGVSGDTEWSPVMPNRTEIITALILIAIILIGNMGGLWLAGAIWG